MEILADGVHRFEGTVSHYTSDGIMALFGASITHEDHAQRARYAALALRAYEDELTRRKNSATLWLTSDNQQSPDKAPVGERALQRRPLRIDLQREVVDDALGGAGDDLQRRVEIAVANGSTGANVRRHGRRAVL